MRNSITVRTSSVALLEIGLAIARASMPDATGFDWLEMGAEMFATPTQS